MNRRRFISWVGVGACSAMVPITVPLLAKNLAKSVSSPLLYETFEELQGIGLRLDHPDFVGDYQAIVRWQGLRYNPDDEMADKVYLKYIEIHAE